MPYHRRSDRPEDFNAFGYDPRGRVANIAGLMFGENWRPDPQGVPRYHGPEVAPPRWGPPADYQVPYLPPNFAPNMPQDGYLGGLQFQGRQGLWANFPIPDQAQEPPRMAFPPENAAPPPPAPTPASSCPSAPTRQANSTSTEVRPGVYRVVVAVNTSTVQKQFTVESDIPFEDLHSRACANLDIDRATASLGYRISGAEGPKTLPSAFSTKEDHTRAMERVTVLISRARTKEYGLEIVNLKPVPVVKAAAKSRKRRRDEDIPPVTDENATLTVAYRQLVAHTACESCKGNCHVTRSGTHQRLDYQELSYWAKQIVLGAADKYNPPDALCFDRRPKRARPLTRSQSGSSGPIPSEIHVHLDGLGDALRFGGSVLGNTATSSSSSIHTPPNTVAPIFEKPTIKTAPGHRLSPSPNAVNESPCDSPLPLPSSPVNLRSPPLREVLAALQATDSNVDYLQMLPALRDAGINTLSDIVSKDEHELLKWTGLPLLKLTGLVDYAKRWEALNRLTRGPQFPVPEESVDGVSDDDNNFDGATLVDEDLSRCSTPEA